jgi:phage gp29-like protein
MARLYTVADAKRRRTAADAWLERMNPLRGLSIQHAMQIYDSARAGSYALLHLVYSEIEKTDPVLLTCVERRAAALAGLGWKADTVTGADAVLAKEQSAAIGELVAGIENFEEALEHLDEGFFRGFAHAEPVFGMDGTVRRLSLPDSWNFCRDGRTGAWWWNPEALSAEPGTNGMTEIPPGRLVTVCRPRAIDYPAMSIYLRCALAERDWGRFVERYGLPPAILTAPANTTKEQETKLASAAGDIADGRSGVVPNGTAINFATEARGTDPFTAFITHQEKLVVLLATGGTLTSLAEAGSGTLAGNAQMDVWRQIVSRDAAIIGAALDRTLVRPYLRARFPGRPVAASFALDADRRRSAEEEFEVAAKARTGGYRIRKDELEKRTGYSLEEEESAPGPGSMLPDGVWNAERLVQGVAKPLQNARGGAGATTGRPGEKPPSAGILEPSAADEGATRVARALQKDLRPAARIIAEALRTGDWKAARKKLAGALKECGTESAEALEREMLAAGEKAWDAAGSDERRGTGDAGEGLEVLELLGEEGVAAANVAERVPGGNGNGGQFTGKTNPPDGGGGKDVSAPENKTEKRQRECREALEAYKASNDHPSADDVASGKVDIHTALKKGFEAEFGGQKVIFFTRRLSDKYEGRGEGGRLGLIRHALEVRTNMFPGRHSGDQVGLVERLTRQNAGRRLVVTADKKTGIAVNVMRCSDEYIKKHYK